MELIADIIRFIGVALGLWFVAYFVGGVLDAGEFGTILMLFTYVCGVIVFATMKILRRLDEIKDQLKKDSK